MGNGGIYNPLSLGLWGIPPYRQGSEAKGGATKVCWAENGRLDRDMGGVVR